MNRLLGNSSDQTYPPRTRIEAYLAKLCGDDVDIPETPNPYSRVEQLLDRMVKEGFITADDLPEGWVVHDGSVVGQTVASITENGLHDTTYNNKVNVSVSNTYTNLDEGKVVNNGELVSQSSTSVTENDTYDTTLLNRVVVNVQNSYTNLDEGKVVHNNALVSQTSVTITENGTHNTTLNNQAVVNVPNTYTNLDEGKVVNNGTLVSQESATYTVNGTYDTTLKNSVIVAVDNTSQILEGTSVPASSLGKDANLYLKKNSNGDLRGVFYKQTQLGWTMVYGIPGYIALVSLPSKLLYNNGEVIAFNGLSAKVYDDDGSEWNDGEINNGVIPFEELTFPVTTANFEGPASIKVVKKPTTSVYAQGDTINYSGIVVNMYDKYGVLLKSPTYPDGTIPISELYFPEETADYT